MNDSPTDAQAELLLIEEKRKIKLEQIVEQSRWDYYAPDSTKGWIVSLPMFVGIVYLAHLAAKSGDGLVFAVIALACVVFAEINRLEGKVDAYIKLSKLKK